MLVCVCMGVSDREIVKALDSGMTSYEDVRNNLGVGTCCGQCASFTKDLVAKENGKNTAQPQFDLAHAVCV